MTRLKALSKDTQSDSLGVSPQVLFDDTLADGKARTFDVSRIPTSLAARKGDAKDTAEQIREGTRWAGFMRYVGGDDRHLAFALEAQRRAAGWPDWSENDLTVSALVLSSAYALDWFCEDFTAEEREQIIAAAVSKGVSQFEAWDRDPTGSANPLRPGASPNHTLANAAAWAALAMVLEGHEPKAQAWLDRAVFHARAALVAAGGPDGSAVEGVSYGSAATVFLRDFDLDLLERTGIDLGAESPWLQSFPRYVQQSMGPRQRVVNFNDTSLEPHLAYQTAALLGVRHAASSANREVAQGLLRAARQAGGKLRFPVPTDLRYVDSSVAALPSAQWSTAEHFPAVGQTVVRTGWSDSDLLLAFHAQPPSPQGVLAHRHYEAGQLLLNWGGDVLLSDPGYAIQSFLEGQIDDTFLEQLGCGATTPAKLAAISLFTLRTPGHNSITLARPDGSWLTQHTTRVSAPAAQLQGPAFFVEAELGAAYTLEDKQTPALEKARRRVLGSLPGVILVHDHVVAAPAVGPLHARFHLNARSHSRAFFGGNGLQGPPAFSTEGASMVITPAGASHRLRVMARGYPDATISTGTVPELACLGSYGVVQNPTPASEVELFTLLLPERTGAAATVTQFLESTDFVGADVTLADGGRVRVRLARAGRAFDPGDGSAAIGLVEELTAGRRRFVVPAPR